MRLDREVARQLFETYQRHRETIEEKLREFRENGGAGVSKLYEELCFCLLTPQTKARAADSALRRLIDSSLLFTGGKKEIMEILRESGVRYYEIKSERLIQARAILDTDFLKRVVELARREPKRAREILIERISGLGMKEASHFLRNVGIRGLAILDRHILRTLRELGVINELPKSLTRRKYLELEEKFLETARELGLNPDVLDLVMWARKTGEVFK